MYTTDGSLAIRWVLMKPEPIPENLYSEKRPAESVQGQAALSSVKTASVAERTSFGQSE